MHILFGWRQLAAVSACINTCLSSPVTKHQLQHSRALYFGRVDPEGGSVVAVAIAKNGSLTNQTNIFSTHGVGLQAISGPDQTTPMVNDPLLSQDSVVVDGNYLFTVNSGSNTVVMFEINPTDPLNLTMIGKPVSSLGSYPVSIAYSSKYKLACALNGGFTNGVACYHVNPKIGLVPDGKGLRNTMLNATTPAIHEGSNPSASDIRFSPDSSRLLVVFKGAFEPLMVTAPIFLYNVSTTGIVGVVGGNASTPELSFAFGSAWNPKNESLVFISDAVFGGVLASINYATAQPTIVNTVSNHTELLGSCWTTYSEIYNTFYVIATLAPNFAAVDANTGDLTRIYSFNSTAGGLDADVAGDKLYFLATASNTIGTLDLSTGNTTMSTYFTPANHAYWQGLAVYRGQ